MYKPVENRPCETPVVSPPPSARTRTKLPFETTTHEEFYRGFSHSQSKGKGRSTSSRTHPDQDIQVQQEQPPGRSTDQQESQPDSQDLKTQ